jgi:hypothetical protein
VASAIRPHSLRDETADRKGEAQLIGTILRDFFAAEIEEAEAAGAIAYMARILVQVTMPHRDPKALRLERTNGTLTVRMTALGEGLPYGTIPRLLLAWMTTEAVRTRKPSLVLGTTLNDFLRRLGLIRAGGPRGDITRLRRQMLRTFSTAISAIDMDPHGRGVRDRGAILPLAAGWDLWWDAKAPNQMGLLPSTVTLGHEFFTAAVAHPVPIDMRALQALRRSPLALDFYCWLTYRMSYLKRDVTVPWEALHAQFGADYSSVRKFRQKARDALRNVVAAYPLARLDAETRGLVLHPSPPHVRKRLSTSR